MKAAIVTHHVNTSVAGSIEAALMTDNKEAPMPLRIRSRAKGRRVISTIAGAQDPESLLTTVDDLLLCLISADKVLSSIRWRKPRHDPRR